MNGLLVLQGVVRVNVAIDAPHQENGHGRLGEWDLRVIHHLFTPGEGVPNREGVRIERSAWRQGGPDSTTSRGADGGNDRRYHPISRRPEKSAGSSSVALS